MSQRCSRRESTGPDSHTRLGIREGKIDHKAQATQKGIIQCRLKVGRENGQAVVMLDALQQIANFKVGVTIMAIAHLTALAKQRIRLIKQQNGAAALGGSKHTRQIFFSFTNPFTNYPGKINLQRYAAGEGGYPLCIAIELHCEGVTACGSLCSW